MDSTQQFDLVTYWRFDVPLERVWAILETPDDWPSWWRAVKKVELLSSGDSNGIGAVRRFTWATALPYELVFDMRVTRIEPMTRIEGEAFGELEGAGIWTLECEGEGTRVRYDWRVRITKPWMQAMAPVLRPVFAWNHGKVMGWGYEGVQRRLRSNR